MEPLVLVGYRVLPPVGAVLTLSSCLVDAVPDDDTWFPSASSAAEHLRPGTNVLAMGVPSAVYPKLRMPWPAELPVLGYELISPEEGGFHSWRCFTEPSDVNAHGLVDTYAAACTLAERAPLPPIAWHPAAVARVPVD